MRTLIVWMLLCIWSSPSSAQSGAVSLPEPVSEPASEPVSGTDQTFTHPALGFQILVPGNAVLTTGEMPLVASIRSRTGWGVNIQAAVHNGQSDVDHMIARLESRYLGNGKPWEEKLLGRQISAFGQPGYEGMYAGSGMRVRLLLLRTPVYDYVILFISPSATFENSFEVFDRILASFRPAQSMETGQSSAQAGGGTAQSDNNAAMQRFNDGKLGYSMAYPGGWQVSRPNPSTAVFAGKAGTDEVLATISVQNVAPPTSGSDRLTVETVMQELQAQMAYSVSDIKHSQGKSFTLGTADNPVEVSQFLSDYRVGDTAFRQWTLAMPRPGEGIVHVWTYVAPLDRFIKYRKIAEQMAGSWRIEPVTGK